MCVSRKSCIMKMVKTPPKTRKIHMKCSQKFKIRVTSIFSKTLHKFSCLKCFWNQYKTVYIQGPSIWRPCCNWYSPTWGPPLTQNTLTGGLLHLLIIKNSQSYAYFCNSFSNSAQLKNKTLDSKASI